MRKLIIVLFLLLPSYAMAQDAKWRAIPSPNMCRGVAPGGVLLWTNCPLAWQKEIIEQGRRKDVSPGSAVFKAAQDMAANKAAVKPAPSIEEKKSPPIIVLPPDAVKPLNDIQMLRRVLELELENAKLKAANVELQLKSANDAFTKAFNEAYIKAGGQTGDGQYKWDVLPDGAWRVTKAVEEKPKTP